MYEIINKNYLEFKPENKILSLFPIEFINKFNAIAYSLINNKLLVLVNENFSFYNYSKLYFFYSGNIVINYISLENWNSIYQLCKLSNKRTDALYQYQFDKNDSNEISLKESQTTFYNAEINNAPIVKLVDSLIGEAVTLKCSDIHLEPTLESIRVKYRIDGKLIDRPSIPYDFLNEISTRIKVMSSLDITKKFLPQDGKLKYELNNQMIDIRVSILPTIYGERFALRILDNSKGLFSIDDLEINDKELNDVLKLINSPSGLILVVGPTGSGKSTSLQTFLSHNISRNENIITVEDPVEYTIPGINQVQINETAGLDFAACLRTILRQDPNIIMIGEIRDVETAQIACRASITGHLVYSTLHTNSSVGVINRLIDMNIEPFLLVDALKGIVSQRLVRCLCPNCKKKEKINEIDAMYLGVEPDTFIYKPVGCSFCNMTGYKGRRGVYEVVLIDDEFRQLISDNASSSKYYKLFTKKKINTLLQNGIKLVIEGITSLEELQSVIE